MSDYEAAVEIGLEIRDVATAIRGIGGTDVESLTDISRSRRARVRELIAKIKERPVTEKAFVLVTGNADLIANVVADRDAAGDLS